MSTTTTYTVTGMTCGHCVNAVRVEVAQLPGVVGVEVDLGSGMVRVESTLPLDLDSVRAAVAEAGYAVEEPR